MAMGIFPCPEMPVGVCVLSWVPDPKGETRTPKCQKPSDGAEAVFTSERRKSSS